MKWLGRVLAGVDHVRPRGVRIQPRQLPPPVELIGRDREVAILTRHLTTLGDSAPIAVITGPTGVGKSALAAAVAGAAAPRFRDGQLFARIGATDGAGDPAGQVAEGFAAALARVDSAGATSSKVDFQQAIARRRVLVMIDDVDAAVSAEAMIPTSNRCAAVLTSTVRRPDLPAHVHLDLQPLSLDATRALLTASLGTHRVDREPAAADALAAATGGFPYAIRAVAASLVLRPHLGLADAASLIQPSPTPASSSLGIPAFDLVFALLTAAQRTALSRLALLDTPLFEQWTVEALLDDADERGAGNAIEGLVRIGLVRSVVGDLAGSRFRVLEPAWTVARRTADSSALAHRRAHARLADARARRLWPGTSRSEVYRCLDQGRLADALGAAKGALWSARERVATKSIQSAPDPGRSELWGDEATVTAVLAELHVELRQPDGRYLATRALDLGETGRSCAYRCLGQIERQAHRFEMAMRYLEIAVQHSRELNSAGELIRSLRDLALARARGPEPSSALADIESAMSLCREEGEELLPSLTFAKGVVLRACDQAEAAEHHLIEASALAREHEQRLWWAWAEHERAKLMLRIRRSAPGRDLALRAMTRFTDIRHRYGVARCRMLVADALADESHFAEAVTLMAEAVQALRTCSDRWIQERALAQLRQLERLRDNEPEPRSDQFAEPEERTPEVVTEWPFIGPAIGGDNQDSVRRPGTTDEPGGDMA